MRSSCGKYFVVSSAVSSLLSAAIAAPHGNDCTGAECQGAADSILLQHGRVFAKRITCATCADVFAGISGACEALAADNGDEVSTVFTSYPELTGCSTMMGCGEKFRSRCSEVAGVEIVISQANQDQQGVVCTEDCAARFKAEGGCDAADSQDWSQVESILHSSNLSDCHRVVCGDSMVQACSDSSTDCSSCAQNFAEAGGCGPLLAGMQAGTMPSSGFTQYIPSGCFACSEETFAYCSTYSASTTVASSSGETGTPTDEACHTAVPGEPCYRHVRWAKNTGILTQPNLYKNSGLQNSSSWEDFQEWLFSNNLHDCPKPCPASG